MPVTETRSTEDPKRVCSEEAASDTDTFTFAPTKTPPLRHESSADKPEGLYSLQRVDTAGLAGAGASDQDTPDSSTGDDGQHPRPGPRPHNHCSVGISRASALISPNTVKPLLKLTNTASRPFPAGTNKFLRPNAVFVGDQESDKRCHVRVEFKTVDLVNSVLTGFLQISGLTPEHSEISTCFKGEIINNPLHRLTCPSQRHSLTDTAVQRYSFITENKQWGSYPKNDLDHWRILSSSSYYDNEHPEDPRLDREETKLKQRLRNIQAGAEDGQFIYMRWKEEFLLPDSRVKQIEGASFEGFYFAVLNIGSIDTSGKGHANRIAPGSINGLYYHKTSSQLQSLNLRYVGENPASDSFEFL